MGQQWWAMGRQLIEASPVVQEAVKACDAAFSELTDRWSLWQELTADEPRSHVDQTEIAQPCILALQVGLTAWWRSLGFEPQAAVGHSVGEIAAAYAAGALSLKDAARVTYHRSRLQQQTAGRGGMLAVGLSAEAVAEQLAPYEGQVSVAAINSRTAVTLAGEREALEQIAQRLQADNVFCRFLRVEVPFHSPVMDQILPELVESLADVRPQPTTIPLVSTVTGGFIDGTELGPRYWGRNAREPVRFAAAAEALIRSEYHCWLELAAHPVLSGYVKESAAAVGASVTVVPTLRRKEPDELVAFNALASLYTEGHRLDWQQLFPAGYRRVKLPSIPWQRQHYWTESEASLRSRRGAAEASHPLLGHRTGAVTNLWQPQLDRSQLRYLQDHRVHGGAVYPAAAYAEMALAAAAEQDGEGQLVLQRLDIDAPLLVGDGPAPTLQLALQKDGSFAIHSRADQANTPWTLHAQGVMCCAIGAPRQRQHRAIAERRQGLTPLAKELFYERLEQRGLEYGPCFQTVQEVWAGSDEALARVVLTEDVRAEAGLYYLHPTLLDGVFQTLAGLPGLPLSQTFLPVRIERLRLMERPGSEVYAHVRIQHWSDHELVGSLSILDGEGTVMAEVEGLRCRRLRSPESDVRNLLYRYEWHQAPRRGEEQKVEAANYLPSPGFFMDKLQADVAALAKDFQRGVYYDDVAPRLDQLCREYLLAALDRLGWKWKPGQQVGTEEVLAELQIDAAHDKLLRSFLGLLANDGFLRADGPRWHVLRPIETDQAPERQWRELLFDYPRYQAELSLLGRCGPQLAGVLRGEVDPLALIFPANLNLAEPLYQDSPTFALYNRLLQAVLAQVPQHLPQGRQLRILEIGGGTGGLTGHLLPLLAGVNVDYVFTDVSTALTNPTARRFRHFPFVRYDLLDIGRDPASQGFEPHSFDIIVESDAIHATADLRQTVDHVKQLLAPGGLLLLLEASSPPRWFEFVFGLTKGWWLFDDNDVRSHATLPASHWESFLRERGFPEVSALGDPGRGDEAIQCVVIARGPAVVDDGTAHVEISAVAPEPALPARPVIVVEQGQASNIAQLLSAQGLKTHRVELRTPSKDSFAIEPHVLQDFQRTLATACPDERHSPLVVCLWGPDRATQERADSAEPDGTARTSQAAMPCATIMGLVQTLLDRTWQGPPSLWLVTRGSQFIGKGGESLDQATLWGMGRVLVNEQADLQTRLVDLSPQPTAEELDSLCREIMSPTQEDELALRGHRRYVHRFVRQTCSLSLTDGTTAAALVTTATKGFDGLTFEERDPPALGSGQVRVQIEATGLNFKDIARTMGMLDDDPRAAALGMEAAGTVVEVGPDVLDLRPGQEVFGLFEGGFANHVVADGRTLVPKPTELTFPEAATLPVAFVTARYVLYDLARVQPGERVLVHTATGGLGLALQQVAHAAGAEVVATAGSKEKRDILRSLGLEVMSDSRSLAFADTIESAVGAQAVDIIVNTLPGKAVQLGLELLRPNTGRFVELANLYSNHVLGLRALKKGVQFLTFDLQSMGQQQPAWVAQQLRHVVEGLKGQWRPLPHRTVAAADVGTAFQAMSQGKHWGKLVVTMQEKGQVPCLPLRQRLPVRAEATYLLVGGLGGFGGALARWIVASGARHLVMVGRSGARKIEAQQTVEELLRAGAQVSVVAADASKGAQLERVISDIDAAMPPLAGVVHAAMVLDDARIVDMTPEQLRRGLEPKVAVAWNLHQATKNRPLDFFWLFSSAASLVGTAGQANYAAGNAFLDALAQWRQAQGLPGLSLGWGPIAEVGFVAEHQDIRTNLERQGTWGVALEQAWQALCYGQRQGLAHLAVAGVRWPTFAKHFIAVSKSPRFAHIVNEALGADNGGSQSAEELTESLDATSPQERGNRLAQLLTRAISAVTRIAEKQLAPDQPLISYGLDSLMAVEVATRLEQAQITVPTMLLLQSGTTISSLVERLESRDQSAAGDAPHPARSAVSASSSAPVVTAAPEQSAATQPPRQETCDETISKLDTKKLLEDAEVGLLETQELLDCAGKLDTQELLERADNLSEEQVEELIKELQKEQP
jgi:acyl transferase domain-containing protein/NADPH:quinone reductase-like Zn-dependent oxidoreductase/aryl carrier-like protein